MFFINISVRNHYVICTELWNLRTKSLQLYMYLLLKSFQIFLYYKLKYKYLQKFHILVSTFGKSWWKLNVRMLKLCNLSPMKLIFSSKKMNEVNHIIFNISMSFEKQLHAPDKKNYMQLSVNYYIQFTWCRDLALTFYI